MARFDPEVVISSRLGDADTGDCITWIELPTDPSRPTVVSFGGRSFEESNPTLDTLLTMVDEAGRSPKRDGLNGSARGVTGLPPEPKEPS